MQTTLKIITIVGARPQFIKAAAVSRAIAGHNRQHRLPLVTERIIHTGQHYDDEMSGIFFRDLGIPEPVNNLGIGSGTHGWQTGQMLIALEEVLFKEKPDWVLVYGDTNSTLAGALAAAKLNHRLAHVEAGLRSHDRTMPEEINRITTDHLSHLLFCPSQDAVDNLANEGIRNGVVMAGDVMADALDHATAETTAKPDILSRLSLSPQGYFLATVHRAANTDNPDNLKDIMTAFSALSETVVLPVHPRTRAILEKLHLQVPDNVLLTPPVRYLESVALMQSARMLLTDSGGMQKEAYWLQTPCVTLRDETEWVETVAHGWNTLCGTNPTRIVETVRGFKTPTTHPPLYGEGRAAEHCLNALLATVRMNSNKDF
jgi:UDP-N-acetylglucosamine 2-epimerase